MMQIASIMSGQTWAMTEMFLRLMKVATCSARNFYDNQPIYRKAIAGYYNRIIASTRRQFPEPVCIIIDTRYDTPGQFHLQHFVEI